MADDNLLHQIKQIDVCVLQALDIDHEGLLLIHAADKSRQMIASTHRDCHLCFDGPWVLR